MLVLNMFTKERVPVVERGGSLVILETLILAIELPCVLNLAAVLSLTACMCNDHAADCQYDTALSASTCLNCTNNTTGRQCDACAGGYYQDQGLLLNDPNICLGEYNAYLEAVANKCLLLECTH
jgi:hypothetical protein